MLLFLLSTLFIFIGATPCRMSPLTTFLTDAQQLALHNIIISARTSGVDEELVKESMDEYLAQVLSPEKLMEFKTAHDEFEAQRGVRGKRSTNDYEKPEPKKVFDIIDQFTNTNNYQKYYEESVAFRNRNKSHED